MGATYALNLLIIVVTLTSKHLLIPLENSILIAFVSCQQVAIAYVLKKVWNRKFCNFFLFRQWPRIYTKFERFNNDSICFLCSLSILSITIWANTRNLDCFLNLLSPTSYGQLSQLSLTTIVISNNLTV